MVIRGDVWLVALDPTMGSEIRKSRPCLLISPPEMHDHLRTAIVAPLTTKSKRAPFRMPVILEGKSGLILLDQMRAVDKIRLVRRLDVVSQKTLTQTLSTLREVFAD